LALKVAERLLAFALSCDPVKELPQCFIREFGLWCFRRMRP
jgi:hypothetical protein